MPLDAGSVGESGRLSGEREQSPVSASSLFTHLWVRGQMNLVTAEQDQPENILYLIGSADFVKFRVTWTAAYANFNWAAYAYCHAQGKVLKPSLYIGLRCLETLLQRIMKPNFHVHYLGIVIISPVEFDKLVNEI